MLYRKQLLYHSLKLTMIWIYESEQLEGIRCAACIRVDTFSHETPTSDLPIHQPHIRNHWHRFGALLSGLHSLCVQAMNNG